MIAVRWNSKGALECPTEMMLAQPSKLCERGERYMLVEMLFDVGTDRAHLPAGEAATIGWQCPSELLTRAGELVRKCTDQRFQVRCADVIVLEHALQFDGRRPEYCIFEEYLWRIHGIRRNGSLELSWIEIQIRYADGRTGLMRLPTEMPGGHERQLVCKLSKCRWRYPVYRRFTLPSSAILVQHEQVHGGTVFDLDPASDPCVDALYHDPIPSAAVPLDCLDW